MKIKGQRYEVGMLWSEQQLKISLGSALLIGAKIAKETKPEKLVSIASSKDTYLEIGFLKILDKVKEKCTLGKERHLPHHPVIKLIKLG